MKRFFTIISFLIVPLAYYAQGIINNGARIVMNGAAYVYVNGATGNYTSQAAGIINNTAAGGSWFVGGNWINNAANFGFSNDGTTVNLYNGAQSIGGTNTTWFYNLTCSGAGNKTLNINTRVGGQNLFNGVLNIGTSATPFVLNGFNLQITNAATTAITVTTGYIVSETNVALNPSTVRWNIGLSTGNYVVPFGTVSGSQIPLGMNITAGTGSAAGYFQVATRPTATSANTPWASTVTHMYDPTLAQDGSDEAVVDRWWEITSSPNAITADVTFRYRGAENTMSVPYNTGNVGAQYWDGAAWMPNNSNIGSAPAVLVGVGSLTAPGLTLGTTYTPWVLSALGAPLPVEFVSVNANCIGQLMQISWTTATEVSNDFFTVERSDDGFLFYPIGTTDGAGSSSQMHNYEFTDPAPVNGTVYYRIRQTDFNGQSDCSPVVVASDCGGTTFVDAFASGANINLLMNVEHASECLVTVFDARSRLVSEHNITAAEGSNRFVLNSVVPATGIYLVVVTTGNGETFTKRLFLEEQ